MTTPRTPILTLDNLLIHPELLVLQKTVWTPPKNPRKNRHTLRDDGFEILVTTHCRVLRAPRPRRQQLHLHDATTRFEAWAETETVEEYWEQTAATMEAENEEKWYPNRADGPPNPAEERAMREWDSLSKKEKREWSDAWLAEDEVVEFVKMAKCHGWAPDVLRPLAGAELRGKMGLVGEMTKSEVASCEGEKLLQKKGEEETSGDAENVKGAANATTTAAAHEEAADQHVIRIVVPIGVPSVKVSTTTAGEDSSAGGRGECKVEWARTCTMKDASTQTTETTETAPLMVDQGTQTDPLPYLYITPASVNKVHSSIKNDVKSELHKTDTVAPKTTKPSSHNADLPTQARTSERTSSGSSISINKISGQTKSVEAKDTAKASSKPGSNNDSISTKDKRVVQQETVHAKKPAELPTSECSTGGSSISINKISGETKTAETKETAKTSGKTSYNNDRVSTEDKRVVQQETVHAKKPAELPTSECSTGGSSISINKISGETKTVETKDTAKISGNTSSNNDCVSTKDKPADHKETVHAKKLAELPTSECATAELPRAPLSTYPENQADVPVRPAPHIQKPQTENHADVPVQAAPHAQKPRAGAKQLDPVTDSLTKLPFTAAPHTQKPLGENHADIQVRLAPHTTKPEAEAKQLDPVTDSLTKLPFTAAPHTQNHLAENHADIQVRLAPHTQEPLIEAKQPEPITSPLPKPPFTAAPPIQESLAENHADIPVQPAPNTQKSLAEAKQPESITAPLPKPPCTAPVDSLSPDKTAALDSPADPTPNPAAPPTRFIPPHLRIPPGARPHPLREVHNRIHAVPAEPTIKPPQVPSTPAPAAPPVQPPPPRNLPAGLPKWMENETPEVLQMFVWTQQRAAEKRARKQQQQQQQQSAPQNAPHAAPHKRTPPTTPPADLPAWLANEPEQAQGMYRWCREQAHHQREAQQRREQLAQQQALAAMPSWEPEPAPTPQRASTPPPGVPAWMANEGSLVLGMFELVREHNERERALREARGRKQQRGRRAQVPHVEVGTEKERVPAGARQTARQPRSPAQNAERPFVSKCVSPNPTIPGWMVGEGSEVTGMMKLRLRELPEDRRRAEEEGMLEPREQRRVERMVRRWLEKIEEHEDWEEWVAPEEE